MEKITITIQEKKPYTGSAETHPEGDFYGNGNKYTCWDKNFYATFKEGDSVLIDYTEKQNDFGGKTYTNRNISKMTYAPTGEISSDVTECTIETPIQQEVQEKTHSFVQPNSEISAGSVILSGIKYDIIMRISHE